jgi:hypothetical protein
MIAYRKRYVMHKLCPLVSSENGKNMGSPAQSEEEYRAYSEYKAAGVSSSEAIKHSRRRGEALMMTYVYGFVLVCKVGAMLGFGALFLPAVEAMSGYQRSSVMGVVVTIAVLAGVIFPIKARSGVFWVFYVIILALASFLAISGLLA